MASGPPTSSPPPNALCTRWKPISKVARRLKSLLLMGDAMDAKDCERITGGFSHPSPCPLPVGERVQRTVIPFAVLTRGR